MSFRGTVREVARVLCAADSAIYRACGDEMITSIALDSREISTGALFFARRGETADGHSFLNDVCERGATACVVESSWIASERGLEFIKSSGNRVSLLIVSDTTEAYGILANYWRRKLMLPTVAVTGSNGKTTTKEILRAILTSVCGVGSANEKSFNNHVGLPQTILSSDASDKWMVLEAGMNHPGELSRLTRIAEPNIAVLLNAAPAHVMSFDGVEDVARAKSELIEGVVPGGTVIVNGDDSLLLHTVREKMRSIAADHSLITFHRVDDESRLLCASATEACYTARVADDKCSSEGELMWLGSRLPYRVPLLGLHNATNAVAAVLAAYHLVSQHPNVSQHPRAPIDVLTTSGVLSGYGASDITSALVRALSSVRGAPMRLQPTKTPHFLLVNDAYNANPASMKAAIDVVGELASPDRVFCALGDMRELGEESSKFHYEVGAYAAKKGIANLFLLGEYARDTERGYLDTGGRCSLCFSSKSEMARRLIEKSDGCEAVLLKASRGMAFEDVASILTESA